MNPRMIMIRERHLDSGRRWWRRVDKINVCCLIYFNDYDWTLNNMMNPRMIMISERHLESGRRWWRVRESGDSRPGNKMKIRGVLI
jgi:hypothetical protein